MSGGELWVNAATALRRACGAAALLGLFTMHGLAVHGAMHAGHGAEPTPSVIAVADHGHDQAGVMTADTRDDSASGASEERAPGSELMGFAGLCLAILLVGAVAAGLLSRPIRIPRGADPATARGWPPRSRRDRDPPCLFALSIQRC
jgi:hypothetical protein